MLQLLNLLSSQTELFFSPFFNALCWTVCVTYESTECTLYQKLTRSHSHSLHWITFSLIPSLFIIPFYSFFYHSFSLLFSLHPTIMLHSLAPSIQIQTKNVVMDVNESGGNAKSLSKVVSKWKEDEEEARIKIIVDENFHPKEPREFNVD